MQTYKVTIAPFIVMSTSPERVKQEVKDFLDNELMVEEEPDSPTEITVQPQ